MRAMLPVTIRNLGKRFGTIAAVDDVSLDVPAGALFFLLGPSGCGKTTLLRMLAGFIDPTAGTIRFGDRDVTGLPPNRRRTAMVFQSYALWPHMTVAQNVAFGLRVRRVPAGQRGQRVAEALAAVQMESYAARKPNELSGGQQQRVALARALVVRPDLLLLDEPLSNLDAKLRLEMRGMIRSICRQARLTAVYVTHDQKEALSMADSLAVMYAGRVVQVGSPAGVYHRPASRFVADFLGESNFLDATVTALEDDTAHLDSPLGKLHSRAWPAGLQPGDRVVCSVRPEAIRILHDADIHDRVSLNCLSARLADTVFLGDMAQHQLVAHDRVALKVFELNPRPAELPAPSSEPDAPATLRLGFHPRDVVVLPA
jgi:iron(III) transport system ATP-binding protein